MLKSENELVNFIANSSVTNKLSIIGSNMDYIAMKYELNQYSLQNFDFKNSFKTSASDQERCCAQAIRDIKANLIDCLDSVTKEMFLIELCTN